MSLRATLFRLYSSLEKIVAPHLKFSQEMYEEVLRSHAPLEGAWLDLGCGHQLLPRWRAQEEVELLRGRNIFGLDPHLPSLLAHQNIPRKALADASAIPFKDDTFALVTANMVVEHLEAPQAQFGEVYRVLKPGGRFIFHTPNLYGYTTLLARFTPELFKKKLVRLVEGRQEEDVFHTFYRANCRKTVAAMAKPIGFEVEEFRLIASTAEFVVLFPLVVLELLWIRFLLTPLGRPLRTNLIAILRKPGP